MKGKCCGLKSPVHLVFGLTMALFGLGKLLGGTEAWTMVGGMVPGALGFSIGGAAVAVGLVVALVELLGGLSFMMCCGKTSKWFAWALTVVMLGAVISVGMGLDLSGASGFGKVTALLMGIGLPLLYGTVFLEYAMKCSKSCKGGSCDTK